MTTTNRQPTTVAELDLPAWLNAAAVLTDDDLAAIREARRVADKALTDAMEARRVIGAVHQRWDAVCTASGDGFDVFDLLAKASGYEDLMEITCLAGSELLDAWDPLSTPDPAHLKGLRENWRYAFPGLVEDDREAAEQ